MPKLRGPLLSLGAKGGLSKLFALVRRRGQHIIERKPIPTDAKSPAQLFNRHMFNKCIDLWHLLSEAEKAEWERLATPRHMTGYAWYISQCLRPNPGIYLPLQGGTMSGDIDMDKHRLLKLPAPSDAQEPLRYNLSSGKMWQGNAANKPAEVDPPAGEAATKEFFVPVTSGTEMTIYGYIPVARCNAVNNKGGMAFRVPHDFSSIVTAEIVVICKATQAAARWDLGSDYGAAGETYNTHHEYDITTTYNVTYEVIEVIDISGILSSLAADDYVGVTISQKTDGHNFEVLGVHFKYS